MCSIVSIITEYTLACGVDLALWFWVAMFCFIFLVSIPDAVGKKFKSELR